MPPPSPVWAWSYSDKKRTRVFHDASFRMRIKVEGVWHESNLLALKVDGAPADDKTK